MSGSGLKMIELPYRGGDSSMLILLPDDKDGLAKLEATLTLDQLVGWFPSMQATGLNLILPKFTFTSKLDLVGDLKDLGLNRPFVFGDADFSGMDGGKDLFISQAIQKAFIEVNEEGTKAAAVTEVAVMLGAAPPPPITFRADHPFLYFIRDNKTGTILFMGRVVDPR